MILGAQNGRGTISTYLLGQLDDIRIRDDVRTQTEIKDNMYGDLIGGGSELVGYWKFTEGKGSIIYDSAGGNNGIVYGADWVQYSANWVYY